MKRKFDRREILNLAWQMVKRNGMSMVDAMKKAWLNAKLKMRMYEGIVKFWFQKVDGTIREAYGTLKSELLPKEGKGSRKMNDSVNVFFDTEKGGWRSYKKANLIMIAQ